MWSSKNIIDVTQDALTDTFEEDKFTHLIIAAPTVDITNMDTSKLTRDDNIEVYKQKVSISCENVVAVAQNALSKHPELERIVIMEHSPRIIIHSASADASADMPENRLIKLKIILKHSRML